MLQKINQCEKCGKFKCYCDFKTERQSRSKGFREYQLVVNYFLILDHQRGKSFSQLARVYKLDRSNLSKRVRGVLNSKNYNGNCHE